MRTSPTFRSLNTDDTLKEEEISVEEVQGTSVIFTGGPDGPMLNVKHLIVRIAPLFFSYLPG